MLQKILDLHIHSKYSRACSRDLELPNIAAQCKRRGIDIVATADFTHPAWFKDIKEQLIEKNEGIFKLKTGEESVGFVLGTEISAIKKHKDKTRRLHLCVFAPDIETVEKINKQFERQGFNLGSDGRPILGITGKELLQLLLEIDERIEMIPAHAWTPWFGIFGSKSGYDSLEEAFEELTPRIRAIETGLSSDPLMNWHWSALDEITLVSNSDAHSTAKLGREANVLNFENEAAVSYSEIMDIIHEKNSDRFVYTIEFYPEEGKYHLDGHRDCKFSCTPVETKKYQGVCPKCKKALTIGVMNRVMELGDRTTEQAKKIAKEKGFTKYKNLVPLPEILADVFACGVNTKRVRMAYEDLLKKLGSEFNVLLNLSLKEIETASDKYIAKAIDKVRQGDIFVKPGYDGEFGVVKVYEDDEQRGGIKQAGLDI